MNRQNYKYFKDTKIRFIDGDRGKNYPSKKELLNQGYCVFLDTSNVVEGGFNFAKNVFISKEKDSILGQGKLQRDDVVLTTRGTIGNTAFYGEEILFKNIRINSGMIIIRSDKTEYLPYYLYLFIRSNLFKTQCKKICSGSAQPQLPVSALNYVSLPGVDLIDQEKTVRSIACFDKKIDLNAKINSELEFLSELIYDYWFLQFEFPDKNGKPYKSSGGEMEFKKEVKKEIPKGWTVKKISEVADCIMGQSPKGDTYNYENKGIGLINGPADYKNKSLYCKTFTTSPSRICQKDDLVLCIRATIGNLVYSESEYCLGRGVAAVRPKNKQYSESIYFHLLKEINRFKLHAGGSIIKGISRDDLSNSYYINPDEKTMKNFHEIVKPMFDLYRSNKVNSLTLQEIRDWLLPMLINKQVKSDY